MDVNAKAVLHYLLMFENFAVQVYYQPIIAIFLLTPAC